MGNKWSKTEAHPVDRDNPRFHVPARISLEKHDISQFPTRYGSENLQIARQQDSFHRQLLELDILQSEVSMDPSHHIGGAIDALYEQAFFSAAQEASIEHGTNVVGVEHYYQWGRELPKAIADAMRDAMPDFTVYETIAKMRGRNRFPVHGIIYHLADNPLPEEQPASFWGDMRKLFSK